MYLRIGGSVGWRESRKLLTKDELRDNRENKTKKRTLRLVDAGDGTESIKSGTSHGRMTKFVASQTSVLSSARLMAPASVVPNAGLEVARE